MTVLYLSPTMCCERVTMGVFPPLSSVPTFGSNRLKLLAFRQWRNHLLFFIPIRSLEPPDPPDPPDFLFPSSPSVPFPFHRNFCAAAPPVTKLSLAGQKFCSGKGVIWISPPRSRSPSPSWTFGAGQPPLVLSHISNSPQPYFHLHNKHLWAWPKLNVDKDKFACPIKISLPGPSVNQFKSNPSDDSLCVYAESIVTISLWKISLPILSLMERTTGEPAACASSGVTRTHLPRKSGSICLSIASLRFYTAVCRSLSFLFMPVGSEVSIFEVHLIEALSLELISFEIDGNVFYTVLVPRELGLLAPNRSDYSFMEVIYTLSFSLVLSDCIVGRKVLESSLLFAEVLTFKIARNIFLHQVSHIPRFVPLVLIAETITIKAAFIAASTIEIRHLNVLMDSLSLVKFLKSRDFVNEPESTLHGIRCLLESFSSIFIVYVFCTANVLAEPLSLFSLLNISSMVGV